VLALLGLVKVGKTLFLRWVLPALLRELGDSKGVPTDFCYFSFSTFVRDEGSVFGLSKDVQWAQFVNAVHFFVLQIVRAVRGHDSEFQAEDFAWKQPTKLTSADVKTFLLALKRQVGNALTKANVFMVFLVDELQFFLALDACRVLASWFFGDTEPFRSSITCISGSGMMMVLQKFAGYAAAGTPPLMATDTVTLPGQATTPVMQLTQRLYLEELLGNEATPEDDSDFEDANDKDLGSAVEDTDEKGHGGGPVGSKLLFEATFGSDIHFVPQVALYGMDAGSTRSKRREATSLSLEMDTILKHTARNPASFLFYAGRVPIRFDPVGVCCFVMYCLSPSTLPLPSARRNPLRCL
jgi:hypothetical protein